MAETRDASGRWLPRVSGSGGRPKGSRNRLGEAFLAALQEHFLEHGTEAIRRLYNEDSVADIRIIVSILPRELAVQADPYDSWADQQIDDCGL